MSFHQSGGGGDAACQYMGSKLWFRGPPGDLSKPYVACLGGEETFGRFVENPFPVELGQRLKLPCINFGSLFCGFEAMLGDPVLSELVNASEFCVLQVPDLPYQSNRFYRVHPRRNDRFVEPTLDLVQLYPEVDFTEIHFVRHLLDRLRAEQGARFEIVVQELQEAWLRACSKLVRRIEPPVILLWLHVQRQAGLHSDPVLPDAAMIERLRPFCSGVVECSVCVTAVSDTLEDVLFGTLQQPMAEHVIGPSAHREIAGKLLPVLRDLN
ncbi:MULTISPECIES: DUF6473 family protein [unclassified Ruegeria]|uniref:DUF6473 family protein n=1 Tax=unclassified Ruegeria TaxID=2625375 RepID=UPI0020A44AD1|nr:MULTISPECIES: DUF6473 family protein [unclassified Ruegeria]